MLKNKHLIILSLSIFLFSSCSQKFYLKKANKFYEQENFLLAHTYYNKAIDKSNQFSDDENLRIANTFYKKKDYKNAQKFYSNVDASKRDYQAELNYATILQFNKDFITAKKSYKSLKNKPDRILSENIIDNYIQSCDLEINYKKPEYSQFNVEKTKINVGGESFGVCFYKKGIIYSAPISPKVKNFILTEINDKTDKYGNGFKDLFFSSITKDGIIKDSSLFYSSANNKHHIGAICFFPDSNRFFFSETIKSKDSSVIKIFSIDKTETGFTNLKELSFNSNRYSCAHPSITQDGQHLYFTSDMKGGYGATDIYVSNLENGKWSKPQNLGNEINTEANETFPFIKKTGVLYFSSDGKVGYGGLDIFYALYRNDKWTHVVHREKPLNSYADDFAYVADPKDESRIFISSNRNSNPGNDNVYFVEKLDLPPDTIRGIVFDNLTDKLITGATLVVVIDSITGDTIAKAFTNSKGEYELIIPKKREEEDEEHLFAVIKKDNYEDNILDFEDRYDDDDRPPFKSKNIAMKLKITEKQVIEFHNIYFDFGKSDLLASSIEVLDKLIDVMHENEKMIIELSAHTDSKSSKAYNKKLSNKRAESAKRYMLSKGISSKRIRAKGYGETRLLNRCKDGINCSDEEHALNRRIEVKVLSNE